MVGGQDELVFDGGSFALQASGEVAMQAPQFSAGLHVVDVDVATRHISSSTQATLPDRHESIYQALVLALRDYVTKSGFKGVLLGLSGGIDSALTLAIACDALGASRVRAVMMPYHYTADISRNDAAEQAAPVSVDEFVVSRRHHQQLAVWRIVDAQPRAAFGGARAFGHRAARARGWREQRA